MTRTSSPEYAYAYPAYYSTANVSPSSSMTSNAEPRSVAFPIVPVTSYSRQLTVEEHWAVHNWELHARSCDFCRDAYHVHRAHGRLCNDGNVLANSVAAYIYSQGDGSQAFSRSDQGSLVYLELHPDYVQVRSLLKALERSQRKAGHQRSILSYDAEYYVAPRIKGPSRHGRRHNHHDEASDGYVAWSDYKAAALAERDAYSRRSKPSGGRRHSGAYDDYEVDLRHPRASSGGRARRYSSYFVG